MAKPRMTKKNKKGIILIVGGILLIGITVLLLFKFDVFGSSKNEVTNNTPSDNKTPVEEKQLKIVDLNSKSRPYAVMINNINVARPLQSGLQDAFIIYEIIVEGGLTRYMALFQDQETARIGSIRSARHYFLDYALESDAIYVHHGYSPQAKSDFSALNVDRVEVNTSKTGWRDNTLKVSTEHTLFTSIDKLDNGVSKLRSERKGSYLLNYSVDEIDLANTDNAKVANSINIKYSGSMSSGYTYDSENKVYKRSVNGKAHTDYVTKEQYTFKNIITYQAKNYTLNDGENKGRQGLENVGSGTGYYITNGYAVPITWEKKSRSAKTVYKLESGEELVVNDGNTFIQIQPTNQSLEIE